MGKIFSVEFLIQSIPQIAVYLPITLLITIASCVAGLIVGFFIALARYFEVRVLKTVAKVYISFIRGTPTMVQLVLVYYGIPILLRVMTKHGEQVLILTESTRSYSQLLHWDLMQRHICQRLSAVH